MEGDLLSDSSGAISGRVRVSLGKRRIYILPLVRKSGKGAAGGGVAFPACIAYLPSAQNKFFMSKEAYFWDDTFWLSSDSRIKYCQRSLASMGLGTGETAPPMSHDLRWKVQATSGQSYPFLPWLLLRAFSGTLGPWQGPGRSPFIAWAGLAEHLHLKPGRRPISAAFRSGTAKPAYLEYRWALWERWRTLRQDPEIEQEPEKGRTECWAEVLEPKLIQGKVFYQRSRHTGLLRRWESGSFISVLTFHDPQGRD